MKVKIRGIDDVQRKIKQYDLKTRAAIQDLVVETGRAIRKEARRRAPRKTGQLRKSIVVKYNKEKTAAFVRATAPYSHIVELGSQNRGITGRPFMQPAAEAVKGPYLQKLAEIMRNAK